MRKTITLITVALLLSAWSATAGIPPTEAQRIISAIRSREPLRSASVGVLAVRMDGDTVAALDFQRKLLPASNIKILTTGMALHTLGADYRFGTTLAHSGEVRGGVLHGDLYIVGGGDPTTGSRSESAIPLSRTHETWMKMLTDAGIRRIEGRVLGDARFFGEATSQHLGWTHDDLGTNYGAGPLGLNFFENAQLLYVTPGAAAGSAPKVTPRYPDTPWMQYSNLATTGAARSANTLYYVCTPLGPFGQVAGSFPLDRRGYMLECHNAFGAYTCASYFCNYLQSRGIEVTGGFGDVTPQGRIRTTLEFGKASTPAEVQQDLTVLGRAYSATLAEIAADTNKESDNFYAETLLRMVAARGGFPTDQDNCEKAAEATLRAMGLRTDNACRQIDGSGLSRKNYVAPAFFVRFLQKMTTLPAWDAFFASLPVPGDKGTLETRMRDGAQELKDRFHMKSGSMNGVFCFSGYILPADGDASHMIVFSLMVNNVTASAFAVYPILEEIMLALAAEN